MSFSFYYILCLFITNMYVLFTIVKLRCSDRHYIYCRVGCKIFYGSESSQTISFLLIGKVVKRWSIGRMRKVILCLWFRASLIYTNNCPTRCNTKQSIYYSAISLYMFRVSTTPIIKSTQNCNYSLRYWSYFLCSYLPPT